MFKKVRITAPSISLIEKTTIIKGDINSESNLRIDGEVEGNITIKGKLILGESSKTSGILNASEIEIYGKTEGTIKALKMISLHEKAIVNGPVFTKQLMVKSGCVVNGKLTIGENNLK
ncbi:MAG: polymer-forming cytoskeletal protein [Bacteroidota bacterium]|nr:polymer-forming cytoskeletal protein [Bacteroidota bacterium]